MSIEVPWEPLTDPKTGRLGRLTISDAMPVPKVIERDASGFVFDFMGPVRGVQPPTDLLERFVSLDNNIDVVRFATRYGALALFESALDKFGWPNPEQLATCCEAHREEIVGWRRVQKLMNLALALFAASDALRPPTIEQLADFNESTSGAFLNLHVLELAGKREILRRDLGLRIPIRYIQTLIAACRVRPAPRVNRSRKVEIVFQDAVGNRPGGSLSLCGALTMQLMAAFAGSRLALCSSCGRAYHPPRRVAAGRNQYCPDCGDQASWRDSKRKRRAEIREEKRRRAQISKQAGMASRRAK